MTYINTGLPFPGILELLFYKKATGSALSNLAQTLLHGPSTLTSGERELIAAHVSRLNDCECCCDSHSAAANAHFQDNGQTIRCLLESPDQLPVSDKMKSLIGLAGKVQQSGKAVTEAIIGKAKIAGATDEEIHDTILIAAAFCMFNRYVDGMGTRVPSDKQDYKKMGERMAKKGYQYPAAILLPFVKYMMKKAHKAA